jgi:hypothetical protein
MVIANFKQNFKIKNISTAMVDLLTAMVSVRVMPQKKGLFPKLFKVV